MARILVQSDSRFPLTIPVVETDEGTSGTCPACGLEISDRGNFEDTIEQIGDHVDRACPWLKEMGK